MEAIIEEQTEGKVIVLGHSFGACTALKVAHRNKSGRIVACFSLDPWCWSIRDEELPIPKMPYIMITSKDF